MFAYKFTEQAVKKIKKLPRKFKKQIFEDILTICEINHPLQSQNVLKLKGNYDEPTFRLRSGKYRIIFRINNNSLIINSVRHRQKGY